MAKSESFHHYFTVDKIQLEAYRQGLSEPVRALAAGLGRIANELKSPAPVRPLDEIKKEIEQKEGILSRYGITVNVDEDKDGLKVILSSGVMTAYSPDGRQGFVAFPFVYKEQEVSMGLFNTYDKDGYLTRVEQELVFPNGDTRKTASAAIRYGDAIGSKRPILDIVITDFGND